MIQEYKFSKGFKFYRGGFRYEVIGIPLVDDKYLVKVSSEEDITCGVIKNLTYAEIIYIMFSESEEKTK